MPFTPDVFAFGPKNVMGRLWWLMIHTIIYLVLQADPFSLIHFLREEEKTGNDFTFVSKCVPISFCGLKKSL